MKTYKNGKYYEETPKEEEERKKSEANLPPAPPSPEQEIAELKRQNEEMRRMIEALEHNALGGI